MTRVLFFTSTLGGGGAEMHLVRVANALDRSAFQPFVAVARPGGSYERRLASDVERFALAPRWARRSSTVAMVASVRPLRRLIRRLEPDLLVSVLDHASLAALAARPRELPVIVSVQNPPAESRRHRRGAGSAWLLRQIARRFPEAEHAIAISTGVERDLLRLVPGLQGRTTVIHNAATDDAVLRDAAAPLPDDMAHESGEILLAAGRLVQQKGYPDLLRAIALLAPSRPRLRLWILGEGPDRQALEQLIAELGIAHHVRLLGFQDNPHRFMRAADVFVLASLWEGFGNVVVEAMSCGTPVVVTATEGPRDILSSPEHGVLVPPADPAALAAAIERVLSDAGERQRLTEGGAARARDFHAAAIARRHGELFLKVLRARRPTPA